MRTKIYSCAALVFASLLLVSCDPPGKEYTLTEFNGIRFNSGETGNFVIEGDVQGYGVDLRGSALTYIKSKDGHKYHYVRLSDGKTRSIVWMDSKQLDLPKGRPRVRITGEIVAIKDIDPAYVLNKRSVGWVKKIEILD
ncbi:MAG: hypothetical protein ACSHX9_10125 [Luteolibacter sp.]